MELKNMTDEALLDAYKKVEEALKGELVWYDRVNLLYYALDLGEELKKRVCPLEYSQ